MAIRDFAEAIQLDPTAGSGYGCRGVAWLEDMKEYDMAIKDFDQAIRLCPKEGHYYYLFRGIAWLGKREFAKAIRDLDEATRLDPEFATEVLNEKLKKGNMILTRQQREFIKNRYSLSDWQPQ